MASDIFIKIKGIEGESADSSHKKEIDVLAWNWGANQMGSAHMGMGAGAGKVSIQDLSFTKFVDSASHALLLACCNGKYIEEAVLVMRKAGEKPLEYLKITLNDLIVASVSTGGSGGEERLTENVSLNFAKFKYEYVPQDAKGAGGAAKTVGWDIPANKAV